MIADKKKFWIETLKATVKITIAGVFIGYFHQFDLFVAIVLCFWTLYKIYSMAFKNGQKNWIIPIGMVISAIIGMSIEITGVHLELWKYHDIPRKFPYWLPFAWLLSFTFIYKIEKEIFKTLKKQTLIEKSKFAIIIVLIFPALGEMITINLGVWTYFISYQILGVPLIAFIALAIVHMFVNLILYNIAKKYNLKDSVFN